MKEHTPFQLRARFCGVLDWLCPCCGFINRSRISRTTWTVQCKAKPCRRTFTVGVLLKSMANLRGLMAELLDPQEFVEAVDAWVSVTVIDDRRPTQMWPRIQQRFPHALLVRHEPAGGIRSASGGSVREQKPSEVAGEFVQYVTNGEIRPDEARAFDDAVQTVRSQEAS